MESRMRIRKAFTVYYESKTRKAQFKNLGVQGTRSHEAGRNTVEVRSRHLRHLEDVLLRERIGRLGEITQEHVDTAFYECVASMDPRISDTISPNTLRGVVNSFKNFIKYHSEHGAIPPGRYGNLVGNLPEVETYKRKMLIIPGKDWPDIFKIAHKRHIMDRVAFELAFFLAMRISEVRTVRWQDLDLTTDSVQFFRDKRSDNLKLDVHPDLKATLLELKGWLEDTGLKVEPSWPIVMARIPHTHGPGTTVHPGIPCQPGVPMDPTTLTRGLHHALREFGVDATDMLCQGMHIARRSRACHLYREGVDIRIIAKILGHKNFLTTLDYIRDGLDDKEIKEAMNLPLRVQEMEVYNNAEQAGNLNTPAVAQTKQAQAMAVLTLVNSGALSEEEASVLLSRMIQ